MRHYKSEIGDAVYELLKLNTVLPFFKICELLKYRGKKNLSIILKNDGRFRRLHNGYGMAVWKIKGCC